VTIDSKRTRIPRIREELYTDITEGDIDTCEQLLHYDEQDELAEFALSLKLSHKHLTFFICMIMDGETEATLDYMKQHTVTRQRANQIKQKIRQIAKEKMI
jgi:hypothetical protein